MRYLLSLTAILLTGSCQIIEPREKEATIYWDKYQTLCTCCGGWRVRIGSRTYRAFDIAEAYAPTDSINVSIRYEDDNSSCGKLMNDLIVITSIRAR